MLKLVHQSDAPPVRSDAPPSRRGLVCALLLSAGLWAAIFAAAHALLG